MMEKELMPYKIIGFFAEDVTQLNSFRKKRATFYVVRKTKTFLCFGKREAEILLAVKQKEISKRDKEIKRLGAQILKDNFILLKMKEASGRK